MQCTHIFRIGACNYNIFIRPYTMFDLFPFTQSSWWETCWTYTLIYTAYTAYTRKICALKFLIMQVPLAWLLTIYLCRLQVFITVNRNCGYYTDDRFQEKFHGFRKGRESCKNFGPKNLNAKSRYLSLPIS